MNPRSAVILLSGGLDSATTLAIAQDQGFSHCHAISFNYGQRHHIELQCAKQLGELFKVASHQWIDIDLRAIGGSALTAPMPVPKDRDQTQMASDIPATYVPARNTIFLAYALARAEVLACGDLFIGVNNVDYSGYPDCRPQYIAAFEKLANLATKAAVLGDKLTIHTPLIYLTKVDIIKQGLSLGVDYSLTHSCYDPTDAGKPCRRCDACLLRMDAFEKLGMLDPVLV